MTNPHFNVIGIGNALVDILCFVEDEFLATHELTKSTMQLSTHEHQSQLLHSLPEFTQASGGSAANTVASLAGLGLNAALIGSVGADSWGDFYSDDLKKMHVTPLVAQSSDQTGTSIVLVTPDSERTMHTHLGAAARVPSHTYSEELSTCHILYTEVYAFDKAQQKVAALRAIENVHNHDNTVAISLSDAGCVQRHQEDFIKLVQQSDIVFGNESEFCQLFEIDEQPISYELLTAHRQLSGKTTVLTQSARGCTVMTQDAIFSTPAKTPAQLIDLTGAGDQFAAGFLYGVLTGQPLVDCAHLGIDLATEVISHVGPRIDISDLVRIATKSS